MLNAITELELAAYSGTCGALTEIGCEPNVNIYIAVLNSTNNSASASLPSANLELILTDLIPGEIILIRAWEEGGNSFGNFKITASDPTPSNDLCSGAISLTVDNISCGSGIGVGDNTYATDSGQMPTPSCANYQGFDLWYSLTIPTSGNVIIETTAGTFGNVDDMGISAYSGNCGSLVEIECDNDDGIGRFSLLDLQGQTPGDVIFLRAWAFDGVEFGNFDICAYEPAPSNDLCSNAIGLILGNSSCGTPTQSTNNVSSTNSGELPAPNCANYQGFDLWYSFVVPASGNILVETSADGTGTITDTGISAYSGVCGTLTELQCDDDGGAARYSLLDLQGQSPGEVILIRAWTLGGSEFGTFNICAHDQGKICPPEFTQANGNRLTVKQSVDALFETDGILESDQLIDSGADVSYDSKVQIDLLSGFEVINGVTFRAYIDGCGEVMVIENEE